MGSPVAASSWATCTARPDDFTYNIVKDPIHIHDLNATILDILGVGKTMLTYRFQAEAFD